MSVLRACLVLAACALAGCESGSLTPGIEASFELEARKSARNAAVPGALTFLTSEGRRVDLENGMLVLVPVEVGRCPSLVARLAELLVPAAFAHGGHVQAPPGVIDVAAATGTRWPLGSLPLAPGDYCSVTLALERLPPGSPGGQPGAVGYVAPCWYPESGSGPDDGPHACHAIAVTGAPRLFTLPLPGAVSVDGSARELTVALALEYDTWFDGIDVEILAGDGPAAADALSRLRDNMAGSVRVESP